MAIETQAPASAGWGKRFLTNVLWSWLGVGASLFTGFFLSPYIIRTLGDHRYGIWALAFAFIDYFNLFDFGFKSATVNLISRARAEGDVKRINEIVSTGLFYFIGMASVVFALTWFLAAHLDAFLKITPQYRAEFTLLVRLIAVGWAAAIALNVFNAAMEGFQRFKVQNAITSISMVLRAAGCAIAVWSGHGLPTMGVIVLFSQITMFGSLAVAFRAAFPELQISPRLMRPAIWRELAAYGVHAFLAYVSTMLLNQGPPLVVGHFLPESFVGYYTLPQRLLQNVIDMITRIGNVTMPNTAELAGQGRDEQILLLGMFLNRYCLALFAPFSVFLLIYGPQLITRWIGPGFAAQAAPLLIPFVAMTTLAVAGQFNSSVILFGLARHETYAKTLLIEALASLSAMVAVIPRYGIMGAACVAASFGVLNRGLVAPYLLSRVMHFHLVTYLRDIYAAPLTLMAPALVYAYWLKTRWIPGRGWVDLIAALPLIAVPYYVACYFAIIDKQHRSLVENWVRRALGTRRATA
jgi:O-antigen/teichoic acid export membrane protein